MRVRQVIKSNFIIGAGTLFCSITPILIWMVLGKLYDDSFANGMVYTYPYQFVYLLIYGVFFRGEIRWQLKNKLENRDHSRTGILLGLLLCLFAAVISIRNADFIASRLGADTEIKKWAFAFGLLILPIDWAVYYMGEEEQLYGQEKKGSELIMKWSLYKITLVAIAAILKLEYQAAVRFIVCAELLEVIALYITRYAPSKLCWKLTKGFKYSLEDVTTNTFMTVVYFLGISKLVSVDLKFVAAQNMVMLCSNTQWDIEGAAVSVSVTKYACDGDFQNKKSRRGIFIGNAVFTGILNISCFVFLAIALLLFKQVDKEIALAMMVIETSMFVGYSVTKTITSYATVINPSAMIVAHEILRYIARLAIQVIIKSPYAVNIAVAGSFVASIPTAVILYVQTRKKEKTIYGDK